MESYSLSQTFVSMQVVYTLSPFQQSVMSGLFKDMPKKLSKKISEVWPWIDVQHVSFGRGTGESETDVGTAR